MAEMTEDEQLKISIHTPTRGVTHQHGSSNRDGRNFNPHSHKGSDTCCKTFSRCHHNFNPHSHKGSDTVSIFLTTVKSISIHTPTRGVTGFSIKITQGISNFNPHSHKGSDLFLGVIMSLVCHFNPHSHKGSDSI